jgi:hypothetical protein
MTGCIADVDPGPGRELSQQRHRLVRGRVSRLITAASCGGW